MVAPPRSTASTAADEVIDVDQRATQVVACRPDRKELGRKLHVPAGGELALRVALAAAAVADDDAGEADVRILGAPGLDQLVERGLAHRVRAQARPGRCERRTDRRQVRGRASRLRELADRGARDERGAGDVRVEGAPPRGRVGFGEPRDLPDPGRVHEGVDPAEAGRSLRDRGPDRILVGHVALECERRAAGFLRAASSKRSRRRASSATCAPRWARPIPMQRPSPLEAPTTTVRNVPPDRVLWAVVRVSRRDRGGRTPRSPRR